MQDVIISVVLFGLGVGLSPLPLVAVVLVLFSPRAPVNGPAYLGGWLVGLVGLSTVTTLVASVIDLGSDDAEGVAAGRLRLVAGLLLFALAARSWHKRPRPGEEPEPPRWMSGIAGMTTGKALRLGLLLSANPKNIAFTTGLVASLGTAELTAAQTGVALGLYVSIGSALVTTAVAYHRFGGSRAEERLGRSREWLQRNNASVMTTMLVVLGVVLVGRGLSALL